MVVSLIYCKWYLLPIDEQMKFKFLILHANMEKTLTIGDIASLSMSTCVSVIQFHLWLGYFDGIKLN